MEKHELLIIDDEPRFRESLAQLLSDEFHVHKAAGSDEGFAILDRHNVSLILLDINMPKVCGVEVLNRVREERGDLKVIIMTGTRDYKVARRCADLNVQGYVEKPFEIEALTLRIKKILQMEEYPFLKALWGPDYNSRITSLSKSVKGALDYIELNWRKDFSRAEMAFDLGISREHLSRLFKKECGIHLTDYINGHKIDESCKHITSNPLARIEKVAASVGIPDANYFSRLFKKHTGLSPSEFKREGISAKTQKPS